MSISPGLPAKVAVRDGVVARSVGEEIVILDLGSGEYFSLNGVGAFIWTQLASGWAPAGIAQSVTDRYEVDLPTAEHDVRDFLADLVKLGLVSA